jgi:chromosomal replication initiation ATPase DnaA
MKQDILNALCGDEVKYNSIMVKTRDRNIVKLRWEVWAILYAKKYTLMAIGEAFKMHYSTVLYGLRQVGIPKIKSKDVGLDQDIKTIMSKIIRFR